MTSDVKNDPQMESEKRCEKRGDEKVKNMRSAMCADIVCIREPAIQRKASRGTANPQQVNGLLKEKLDALL